MQHSVLMRTLATLTAIAALLGCSGCGKQDAKAGDMRDMTTQQIVDEMGIGINLGNTYESCGDWIAQYGDDTPQAYATAWGSPVITQEIIQGYADAGFGVLRVPVAWSNMMADDGKYTIHADYLASVREVVDWAMADGMYVILNIHWDGGWFKNFPTDQENCMKKYVTIWEQLSAAFKDYDDHLMLESLNEEGGWNSLWNQWSGSTEGKEESYGLLNEMNQNFVDTVRASGGNNAQRHLLIAGYTTDIALTCDPLFQMPSDPAGRCAVSVHYYTPSTFAILEEDADWGKAQSTWGTEKEIAELQANLDLCKTTFVDQGVPVIIGEYGCPKKNKDAESVNRYITAVASEAAERGICPVLWDITDLHYNRTTCKMVDDALAAALREIATQ